MLRFLGIALLQCLLLSSAQVVLKISLQKLGEISGFWEGFKGVFHNWVPWTATGVLFMSATGVWFYMLRNFDFSLAYPITSVAYIFGMLASMFIFKEAIPVERWIGVGLIVVGVFFMLKQ